MDPHFQPQNNPSHPSQNQTGPSLYPTLPPIQNPQYQPPSQHHPQQYPQNYPQNNPYNPSAGHAGYVPLANHGNGPNQGVNAESFLDAEKMRELERGLDSCFIKCYNIWLWVTIVCCGLTILQTVIALGSASGSPDGALFTSGSVIYTIWAIVQSVFGVQAISQKSLSKANVACWMMVISLIPSVIAVFWLIIAIVNHVPDKSDDSYHLWYIIMEYFLTLAVVNTLISLFVNVNGAFKVRNILSERNILQEKIERASDAIYP